MGCGSPSVAVESVGVRRKKASLIDCRRRSTNVSDVVVEDVALKEVTPDDLKWAVERLRSHPLFSSLSETEAEAVSAELVGGETKKEHYVFRQGDSGGCFFLIRQGSVDVEVDGKIVLRLGSGQSFGELALLFRSQRAASIIARSNPTRFLVMRPGLYKRTLQQLKNSEYTQSAQIIEEVALFQCLTNKQKYFLSHALKAVKFRAGETIFREGDESNAIYILAQGAISIQIPGQKEVKLGALEVFGQRSLRGEKARRAGTAKAMEASMCLAVGRKDLEKLLGNSMQTLLFYSAKKWALMQLDYFADYSKDELDRINMGFVSVFLEHGQKLQSALYKGFLVALEGTIEPLSEKEGDKNESKEEIANRQIANRQIANKEIANKGEQTDPKRQNKENIKRDTRSSNVQTKGKKSEKVKKTEGKMVNAEWLEGKSPKGTWVKKGAGYVGFLAFQKFKEIEFGVEGRRKLMRASQRKIAENPVDVHVRDFGYCRKLGEGQFGRVFLVRDQVTGSHYAVKCLEKEALREEGMEQSVLQQRRILKASLFPYIVGFVKAFHDQKHLFFVMEYIHGKEMFDVIREMPLLPREVARYFFACILLAVEYLHANNIIYRDIKPQNSVVDARGKAYLIDMGTAKELQRANCFRTFTIIGTPHYMAPEVLEGRGYSFQSDFWSLGILLYELVCARLPYGEHLKSNDNVAMQIFSEIKSHRLDFPKFVTDDATKSILRLLLTQNPKDRAENFSFQRVKQMDFFVGFNWEALLDEKMIPPYIPKDFRKNGTIPVFKQHTSLLNQIYDKHPPRYQPQDWNTDYF